MLCSHDMKKHTVTLRNKHMIPRKPRMLSGKGPTERDGQALGGSNEPVSLGSSVQIFLEAQLYTRCDRPNDVSRTFVCPVDSLKDFVE